MYHKCSMEEALHWAEFAVVEGLKLNKDIYVNLVGKLAEAFKARIETQDRLSWDVSIYFDDERRRLIAAWKRTEENAKGEEDHLASAISFYKTPYFDGRLPSESSLKAKLA